MARSIYVYYRINAAALPEVAAAVRRFQAALSNAYPALQVAVLRRPGEKDGEVTLMETYAMPGGVNESVQAQIAAAATALAPWQRGARHTEVFESLP